MKLAQLYTGTLERISQYRKQNALVPYSIENVRERNRHCCLFCKKASNCNTNAIRLHYNRLIAVKRDSSKTNTNKHFCPSLEKQTYAPFISYNNSHQTCQSRPQAWKDLISHGFRKYTLFSPSAVLIRGSSWPGVMSTATTFFASLPAFIHSISLQTDYHLYMQGQLCLRTEYYRGSPLFPEHVFECHTHPS